MTAPEKGPVVVKIHISIGFSGAAYDEIEEIDRDEWNKLTPSQRDAALNELVRDALANRNHSHWAIDDPYDYVETESGQC